MKVRILGQGGLTRGQWFDARYTQLVWSKALGGPLAESDK